MTQQSISQTAELVWALTHIQPATAREMAELLDVDPQAVCRSLTRMNRSGVVTREKRRGEGRGRQPYEYRIASIEDFHDRRATYEMGRGVV